MLPWNVEDLTFDETRFTGAVRLFPLPDLVMFPHVMQPLHIFESRYREMLNEALDSDGLIAMSVLAPGWEGDYEGRPALLPHVCLGKVITHQRLPDGTYNLLLLGMRRARIICETPPERAFRQAEVELLDDFYHPDGEAERPEIQAELTERFQNAISLPKNQANAGALGELLAAEAPLGVLTDLAAFALPLPTQLKIELQAECDVDRRAQLLLEALAKPLELTSAPADQPTRRFPPRFSRN